MFLLTEGREEEKRRDRNIANSHGYGRHIWFVRFTVDLERKIRSPSEYETQGCHDRCYFILCHTPAVETPAEVASREVVPAQPLHHLLVRD